MAKNRDLEFSKLFLLAALFGLKQPTHQWVPSVDYNDVPIAC